MMENLIPITPGGRPAGACPTFTLTLAARAALCIAVGLFAGGRTSADENVASLKRLHVSEKHASRVLSVSFTRDSRRLASTQSDGRDVWLTDVKTGRIEKRTNHSGVVFVQCSPTSDEVALSGEDLTIWEPNAATTRTLRDAVIGHEFGEVCFSPDGKLIVAAGEAGGAAGHVYVWQARTGKLKSTLKGHRNQVTSVRVSPCGKLIVSGGLYGDVLLWDVQSGRVVARLRKGTGQADALPKIVPTTDAALSVRFSPDGNTIAAVTQNAATGSRIEFYNRKGGKTEAWRADGTIEPSKGRESYCEVAFSPVAGVLAAADRNGRGVLIDVETRKVVAEFDNRPSNRRPVTAGPYFSCLAFSPDGRRMASGYDNGVVIIWKVPPRYLPES